MSGAGSGGRVGVLAVVSAALLIATFNLAGWAVVDRASDELEREFGRRLISIGRATVAGLDRDRLERLERPVSRELVGLKLREVREQLGLSELFLFTQEDLVVADSRPEREPWHATYVHLTPYLLSRSWAGQPRSTDVRYVEGEPFMDAFVPVPDLEGRVRYVLAVEDSPWRLEVFRKLRRSLWWAAGVSAAVVILMTVAQVGVFRRLLEARRRAALAERFSALGQLGATVAHEIRNPLTSLSATAQVVLRRFRKSGRVDEEMLEDIPKEVERVNRIVTDFLSFARETPLARSEVEPAGLLDAALRRCAPGGAVGEVPVGLEVGSRVPGKVTADPDKLQQVVSNLVLNAAQAVESGGGEGGRVRVRVDGTRLRGRPAWRVVVEDDGPGVPEEDRVRVFEPYFTSKAKGTGLGLAVTRKVVEAHGGEVRCDRADGGGARFTVTLPCEES